MMSNSHQFSIGEVYDPSIAKQDPVTRKDTLEGVAYKVVERSYTKHLTLEDLEDKKSELAEISIKLDELETKKKELMAEMKKEMETPSQVKKELLKAIKFQAEEREGVLYYMDDQEGGMMHIFDDTATCVEVRALRQDERQTSIHTMHKTGTDGE